MKNTTKPLAAAIAPLVLLATLAVPAIAVAQGYAPGQAGGYSYSEVQGGGATPLVFGIAAYKLCQIKTAFFAITYVLCGIAFAVFAIRAVFTKFEFKSFIPIIASVFILGMTDLIIAGLSDQAYYCPAVLTQVGQ